MQRKNYLTLVAGLVIALITVVMNSAAMAQVSGAIFTTNEYSTFVNGNVYNSITDVYLNGGPRPNAPCSAAGLPDGQYYFQVTDPSGHVLLSDYGINNGVIEVYGGLITGYSQGLELRGTGFGKCNDGINHTNNITVQLAPFSTTPNPGGEYKVWMTKTIDYDPTKGSYGFIPSKSKTDNFKVPSDDNCCTEG
jgi:hypothetical protein